LPPEFITWFTICWAWSGKVLACWGELRFIWWV